MHRRTLRLDRCLTVFPLPRPHGVHEDRDKALLHETATSLPLPIDLTVSTRAGGAVEQPPGRFCIAASGGSDEGRRVYGRRSTAIRLSR